MGHRAVINKTDFVKWFTRATRDVTEEGSFSRFELLHSVSGQAPERIEVFPASEITDLEDFATILDTSSKHDAATRLGGTPERYVIAAYRGEATEPEVSYPWLVEPTPRAMSLGESSDPPTNTGQLAQHMRIVNDLHRLLANQSMVSQSHLVDDLERERRRRLEAEAELEELHHAQANAQGPMNMLAGVITQMLPILVAQFMTPHPGAAKLSGQSTMQQMSLPPAPSVNTGVSGIEFDALIKLFQELSPAELMGILQAVSQIHQLALMEIQKTITDGGDLNLVKLSARNLLAELSPQELERVAGAMTPEHAGLFIEIYKAMARGGVEEPKA